MCVFCKLEVFVPSHMRANFATYAHVFLQTGCFCTPSSYACFLQVGGLCALSYACLLQIGAPSYACFLQVGGLCTLSHACFCKLEVLVLPHMRAFCKLEVSILSHMRVFCKLEVFVLLHAELLKPMNL